MNKTSLKGFADLKFMKGGPRGKWSDSKFYKNAKAIEPILLKHNWEVTPEVYAEIESTAGLERANAYTIIAEMVRAGQGGYEDLESYCEKGREFSPSKRKIVAKK